VQVTGLGAVPVAGDEFDIIDTIDEARDMAEERAVELRKQRLTAQAGEGKVTLASLGNALAGGDEAATEHHMLNVVLKVDVQVRRVTSTKV
jgi:translation initiation factor IF-2